MTRRAFAALFALVLAAYSFPPLAHATAQIGKAAPDFAVMGSDGRMHTLSEYKGKIVVLEWLNHGCPYVRKHYDTGNMQALQKEMTDKDVIWLSVISSAPGQQGFSSADKANADAQTNDAHATGILLDEKGEVGRLYEAKTTPHMFVINADGTLVYKGAIDDQPTFAHDTVAGAKNYVRQAINEVKDGKAVSEPATTPYGCGVKY
jgi:hypothetical protein